MKIKCINYFIATSICILVSSCKTPAIVSAPVNKAIPESFSNVKDTTNISKISYNSLRIKI